MGNISQENKMRRGNWVELLVIMVLVTACTTTGTLPTATPTVALPTATLTAPAATHIPTVTPYPRLTAEKLKNAEYHLPQSNQTVTLTNGRYEAGSGSDYLLVEILPQIAFGDLDGDRVEDAALLIGENSGGSGTFVSVFAILNHDGQPIQAGAALVDDRPQINQIAIQDGRIVLEAVIHSFSDPLTSPSFAVSETYQLTMSGLKLRRFTSQTPNGMVRSIDIASPTPGASVSGSVQVTGSMPIAPFENNLAYRISDDSGNILAGGSFAVNSDGMGGPATFDTRIEIPELPVGTVIWIELLDTSMADGSILALDSVRLRAE